MKRLRELVYPRSPVNNWLDDISRDLDTAEPEELSELYSSLTYHHVKQSGRCP
ncbi:hypothetical protein AB0I34_36320 [Kribbella sp. NPDC050281]|uniref:hypothetical protein n=1 Tax=Kribbella sp. NPDC050281 TaxID=3155515 RepID=UPI0033E28C91